MDKMCARLTVPISHTENSIVFSNIGTMCMLLLYYKKHNKYRETAFDILTLPKERAIIKGNTTQAEKRALYGIGCA